MMNPIIQVGGGGKRKELTDTAAVGMVVRAQRVKWLAILSRLLRLRALHLFTHVLAWGFI